MYKRILVPTDGSEITAKAVDTAVALARLSGASLSTLCVKEPFPYSAISEMQPVPPQEFFDAQERIAAERVKAVMAAVLVMEKEGVSQAFGVPGAAINPLYAALKAHGGIGHILARHVDIVSEQCDERIPVETPDDRRSAVERR